MGLFDMIGGLFGGGDSGGSTTQAQTIYPKQYSFTEPRMQLTSDFYTQQLQGLMEGQAPQWWQKQAPMVKQGMQRGLQETFYGSPMGGPGVMENVRSAGAATGVGPKATMAGTDKAMLEYANKSKQIDEYIAGQGIEVSREAARTLPYMSQMMPQGPQSTTIGPYQIAEGGGGVADMWGSIGGMMGQMPWGDIMQGVGNLFSSGSGTVQGGQGGQMLQSPQYGNTWSPYSSGSSSPGHWT